LFSLTPFSSPPTSPSSIYTLSLHDALPISSAGSPAQFQDALRSGARSTTRSTLDRLLPRRYNRSAFSSCSRSESHRHEAARHTRSEEHTSELQSRFDLVCRLLLEKKKKDK